MRDYFFLSAKLCKRHIFKISLTAMLLFCATSILWYGHLEDCLLFYNKQLSSLSYIAVIATAGSIAHQANSFVRDYNARKVHSEFETAYKLAGQYSISLIPQMSFASKFLNNINRRVCEDYYKKVASFRNFTKAEAEIIFGSDVLEKYDQEIEREILSIIDTEYQFIQFLRSSDMGVNGIEDWKLLTKDAKPTTSKKIKSVIMRREITFMLY